MHDDDGRKHRRDHHREGGAQRASQTLNQEKQYEKRQCADRQCRPPQRNQVTVVKRPQHLERPVEHTTNVRVDEDGPRQPPSAEHEMGVAAAAEGDPRVTVADVDRARDMVLDDDLGGRRRSMADQLFVVSNLGARKIPALCQEDTDRDDEHDPRIARVEHRAPHARPARFAPQRRTSGY